MNNDDISLYGLLQHDVHIRGIRHCETDTLSLHDLFCAFLDGSGRMTDYIICVFGTEEFVDELKELMYNAGMHTDKFSFVYIEKTNLRISVLGCWAKEDGVID